MTIGQWWRKLQGRRQAVVVDRSVIARHEALGEQAYTAMYDSRRPKDDYEDSRGHFHEAIAAARHLGLADEVERLTRRRDHIAAVYDHQFRS